MGTRRPVPDILLERYVLGEVTPAERAALDERAAADPSFAEAVNSIKKSNQEILLAHPAAETAAAINARFGLASGAAPRGKPVFRLAWVPAAALAVVAVGAVIVFQERGSERLTGSVEPEVTRAKGNGNVPHLVVRRLGREGIEVLSDGASAKAGETLQLSYVGKGARFGVIVSLDGRGRVTVHLPMDGSESAPLDPKTETALPRSFELDDAPRFERFFFVTSERPFKVSVVTAAASDLAREIERSASAPLVLDEGLAQMSFTVRKVSQ